MLRDPTVLTDLFTPSDCSKDESFITSTNTPNSFLEDTECKYYVANIIFPKTKNTYVFFSFCLNIGSICNFKNFVNLKCVLESMSSYPTVIGIIET